MLAHVKARITSNYSNGILSQSPRIGSAGRELVLHPVLRYRSSNIGHLTLAVLPLGPQVESPSGRVLCWCVCRLPKTKWRRFGFGAPQGGTCVGGAAAESKPVNQADSSSMLTTMCTPDTKQRASHAHLPSCIRCDADYTPHPLRSVPVLQLR